MGFSCARLLLVCGLVIQLCSAVPVPSSDNSTETSTRREKQKLLVILLDGFRWNYAAKTSAKEHSGFAKMKDIGVTAKYLQPVFPTMSYPNYQSLVTGLYPENHGMVMNYMHDENRDAIFDMLPSANSRQEFWWNESLPIWMEATKAGLRTYLYDWPGCEVVFNETLKPEYCKPYEFTTKLDTFHTYASDVIAKFTDDEADFAQIYVEYPDYVGHKDGPDSTSMLLAIREIDEAIYEFIELLQEFTTEKIKTKTSTYSKSSKWKKKTKTTLVHKVKVNVIVVSDHGMTATDSKHVRRVSLDTALNLNDVKYITGQGASVGVYPQPYRDNQVYNDLLKMNDSIRVWKKQDIPEHFHIKNHPHTPPIFVLAKKGYFIEAIKDNNKQIPRVKMEDTGKYKGYHGYDPDEVNDMRGIFYGFGYSFNRHKSVPPINMVDVYNLMSELLGLDRRPNNGSWSKVDTYLKPITSASSKIWCNSMSGILSLCLFTFIQVKWWWP